MVGFRVGFGCALAAIVGSVQASTLTPTSSYLGNTTWQNIGGVTYSYNDVNHDGLLEVGEKVTFTVAMEKKNWGTHQFDALKAWIADASGKDLSTNDFTWVYDPSKENLKWFNKPGDPYSYKAWTGGAKSFTFDYTFAAAGTFDLSLSVMCSRDLASLSGVSDDNPTTADWDEWTKNIHKARPRLQGEDKNYKLTVLAPPVLPPVPEPETYAMLMAGLGVLGAMARRKKQA